MRSDGFVETLWVLNALIVVVSLIVGKVRSRVYKHESMRDAGFLVKDYTVSILLWLTGGLLSIVVLLALVSGFLHIA